MLCHGYIGLLRSQLKCLPLGDFLWYPVDTVSISKAKNALGKGEVLCLCMTIKLS